MSTLAFENLRLRNVKGLRECSLSRLGRINVICGRNNSGKSTILEAIVAKDKRFPGSIVGPEQVSRVFDAVLPYAGWAQVNNYAPENAVLRAIVAQELKDPRCLFSDDSHLIEAGISKRFSQSQLSRWQFSAQGVANVFLELMSNDHVAVLVSPKRRLDTTKPVIANEEVVRDGSGILNFLFFAKNQPNSSEESKVYHRIVEAFENISNGYSFDVFLGRNNALDLRFAHRHANWIAASDCGLGLQDLLVLLYFSIVPEFSVVAIEEPESHLHPDMQRRLLGFFRACEDRQFFISTHSNVFLNNVYVDRVFFATFVDDVQVDDATSRASMLDDLGYSVADNLVSDVVVLVEGPTDTPIIEELLLKKGVLPRFDVKIWPLGGDIMDQVDLSVLLQSYKVIALLDRDPGSSKVRKRFKERCAAAGIPVIQLKRYAIENYFPLDVLREVFGSQIPVEVVALEGGKPLDEQIGINVKKNNRRLSRAMSIESIEGTDLGRFLDQVAELCEDNPSAA